MTTRSAYTSGYMDDIALEGNIRDVDVDYIRTEGESIGLFLNNEKCEIISRSDTSNLTHASTIYKFAILRPEDSTLLGAPLSIRFLLRRQDFQTSLCHLSPSLFTGPGSPNNTEVVI